MRSYSLLIALLISACGSDDSADKAADNTTILGDQLATAESAPERALLVQDASALPVCDEASDGLLVYVKADAQFQACAAGAWEVIDLKGKDGVDGKNGEDGEDGVDSSSTVWLDPITGLRWLAAANNTGTAAANSCTSPYRFPACDELVEAAIHGLYNGLPVATEVWCGDNLGDSAIIDANPAQSTESFTNTIGVYCVEAER
jgi:hypothetical protein